MKRTKDKRGLEKTKPFQKKILYIEDNQDTAEAVKLILNNAGFETEIALRGKEGILRAKKGYDLILIDIMLPDMSGWDVFTKLIKKVKSRFAFLSAIPVSNERMEELRKSGVSDYITKPFEKPDLLNRVKNILGTTLQK